MMQPKYKFKTLFWEVMGFIALVICICVVCISENNKQWQIKYDHKRVDTVYIREHQVTPDSIIFKCRKCKTEYRLQARDR